MMALEYDCPPWRWVACKLAGFATPAAYYAPPLSGLRLTDRAPPALPGPGWVRLRTRLGGVCGTDLALIAQRNHPATILQRFAAFPAVLGHENVATIDAVGPDCGAWKTGDRVCVEPAVGCAGRGVVEACRYCAAGMPTLCVQGGDGVMPPRPMLGLNRLTRGSWATHFVAHESQLHRVPDGLTDDAAVLTDPLASSAHAVLRRLPRPGESVLVNGAGIVGLGIIAAIRAMRLDNPITIVARRDHQAEIATRLGATHVARHRRGQSAAERYRDIATRVGGRSYPGRFGNQGLVGGFDLTFDCTGSGAGLTDALKWTRTRGTVVAVGTSGITLLDTTPLWFDEIEIIGANGRQIESIDGRRIHTYGLVHEWMTGGRLDVTVLPVTRYALRDYRSAFRDLLTRPPRRPIIKAVFAPE